MKFIKNIGFLAAILFGGVAYANDCVEVILAEKDRIQAPDGNIYNVTPGTKYCIRSDGRIGTFSQPQQQDRGYTTVPHQPVESNQQRQSGTYMVNNNQEGPLVRALAGVQVITGIAHQVESIKDRRSQRKINERNSGCWSCGYHGGGNVVIIPQSTYRHHGTGLDYRGNRPTVAVQGPTQPGGCSRSYTSAGGMRVHC